MVFRKDSKAGDAFQRQINALRQQLGGSAYSEENESELATDPALEQVAMVEEDYSVSRPEFDEGFQGYSRGYVYEEAPVEQYAPSPSDEPLPPAIPVIDTQTTVVSHNTSWKGEVTSDGSMHILGRFEGQINAREDVFILEDAQVEAAIAAATVVISGRYNGTVNCGNRLEVLPTGRVIGEVFAPTLVVHNGAVINGNVKMTGSAPTEQIPATVLHRRGTRGTA